MMERGKLSAGALWFAYLVPPAFAAILVLPATRGVFLAATAGHPYVMGFVKFAFLATSGEILAAKVSGRAFRFSSAAAYKAAIWGLIGMMITVLFPVYSAGIRAAQGAGLLFGEGSVAATAFLTSAVMNLTFGIAMMAFHRLTDTLVEMRCSGRPASVRDAVTGVDWPGFIDFVVFRTIPLFWIPAHTVTFLVPGEYRVFLSAFLSIALGLLLALARGRPSGN